jgi:hypothetical protein
MALRKATTATTKARPKVVAPKVAAPKVAATKRVTKRATVVKKEPDDVFTIKDLVGKDLKERVFIPVPGQTGVDRLSYWGATAVPKSAFITSGLVVNTNWAGKDKPLYTLAFLDEVLGYQNTYVHPDLKIKELKQKTAKLEEMFRLQNIQVKAGQMFPWGRLGGFIGTDPEIFAVDEKGELIPAFEFLGPKKNNTRYWDGYQAEFTVQAGECMAHFVDRIQYQLRDMLKDLRKLNPKASLSMKNTFDISPERLKTDKPEYVNFGCHPSFNVYDEEKIAVEGKDVPFRSAGGHLHFSLSAKGKERIPKIVKELDRVLGVISVSLFQYYDDPRRRMFYGKAGEYRTPPHGLEYRVLSNAWLCHPVMAHFTFELARKVIGSVVNGNQSVPNWDITEEEARLCINTCDVGMAQALLKRNETNLEALLYCMPGIYGNTATTLKWKNIVMDGVHKYLNNPDVPSIAWKLEKGGWTTHSEGKCENLTHTCRFMVASNTNMLDWKD